MRRWIVPMIVALGVVVLVMITYEDDSGNQSGRCSAINRWSFQAGNAISDHPDYAWFRQNCR